MRRLLAVIAILLPMTSWAGTCGNGYSFSRQIKLQKAQGADQSNFPYLINGTYYAFKTAANGGQVQNTAANSLSITGPADLIFCDAASAGNQLKHEVVYYSATVGTIEAWVKIPTLHNASQDSIWVFINNSSVTTSQQDLSLWSDAGYVGVYHLPDGSTLGAKDSAGVSNGTINGSPTAVAGQIDGGANNWSNANYIRVTSSATQRPAALALEAWLKPTACSTDPYAVNLPYNNSWTSPWVAFAIGLHGTTCDPAFQFTVSGTLRDANGTTALPLNTWSLVANTFNSGTTNIYVNGVAQTLNWSSTIPAGGSSLDYGSAADWAIGMRSPYSAGQPFVGSEDEIRVRNSASSANWLATRYSVEAGVNQGYYIVEPTAATTYTDDFKPSANMPNDTQGATGTWAIANDGVNNYLHSTTTGSESFAMIFAGSPALTTTYQWTVGFSNTATPTTSYVYPSFGTGSGYEVAMSRGSGEARGALWVQKCVLSAYYQSVGTCTYTTSSFVGTSGTTFTGGNIYNVTATDTISGTSHVWAVQVQRVGDQMYLNSSGTWQTASATAVTWTDTYLSQYFFGGLGVKVNQSTDDVRVYSIGYTNSSTEPAPYLDTRYPSNPVVAKSSTYNGILADALAAPSATFNGSTFAMTASAWNITNSKWYSVFFTSSDMVTWTYQTGSLLSPSGSDYILGNGGLTWWNGKYWFCFSHHHSDGTSAFIGLRNTTDATFQSGTWTVVNDNLVSGTNYDPSLSVNPATNKLELWYMKDDGLNLGHVRTLHMQDSPDGTTWTDEGDFLTLYFVNFGEPDVFYVSGVRYMVFDSSMRLGSRFTLLAHSPGNNTSYVMDNMVVAPTAAIPAENHQVFDTSSLVVDLHDGLGNIPRMLYAGSNGTSSTDNTNSNINLANAQSLVSSQGPRHRVRQY